MESYLTILLQLIQNNQLSELEAERLLNAAARFEAKQPTGPDSSTRTHNNVR